MYSDSIRQAALNRLAEGWSINRTSKDLQVSRAAIRDWRARPGIAPRQCPAPPVSSPEYAALFGYYLGDGCISPNGGAYALRISCDAALQGIVADVECCVSDVHPARRVYRIRAPGVVVVQSYWKHWPCLFPQHGPGRKHERELLMAPWQWAIVEEHPADFLRGLFHSDGCRVKNWATRMVAGERKRYDYPRWQFTNESAEIMGWCGDALDLLGIGWRRSNRKTLSVSTRAGVARLDALIGPKS